MKKHFITIAISAMFASNAVADVGEWPTVGDGFYPDGSFIQHDSVAYNGTYGTMLFDDLGQFYI